MESSLSTLIEQDASTPSTDKLDVLRKAVRTVRDLEFLIADREENLRMLKAQLNDNKHKFLPDLFDQAGVDRVGLPAEGNAPAYDAVAVPYYHANIPIEKQKEAFSWLEKKGHGDLIKRTYTVEFGKGEEKASRDFEKLLQKNKIGFTIKLGVPWNTLTAFVKEQVEKFKTIPPLETLGATVGRVVKLKERKD